MKDYLRYLWFKGKCRFGVITHEMMGKGARSTNAYWMRKLVSRGWASKTHLGYQLRSYPHVWTTMGTKKVVKKKTKRQCFKYNILPNYALQNPPGEFVKYCLKYIQEEKVVTKKSQIVHRLVTEAARKGEISIKNKTQVLRKRNEILIFEKPVFSGEASRKLFGYKSRNCGLRMLKKMFDIELQEYLPKVYQYLNCKGDLVWRVSPFHIHLG